MINVEIKFNRVIVQNDNLLFSVDEFSKKYYGYLVAFFINFLLDHDQVGFDKESWVLTGFQTSPILTRITRLPQKATSSVAYFMKIVIKILVAPLQDKTSSFMNDMVPKSL